MSLGVRVYGFRVFVLGVYGFQGFSALGFRVYVTLSPEFQRPSTLAGP